MLENTLSTTVDGLPTIDETELDAVVGGGVCIGVRTGGGGCWGISWGNWPRPSTD